MRTPLSRLLLTLASILTAVAALGAQAPERPGVRVAEAVRAAIEGAASIQEAKAAVGGLPKVLGATYGDQKAADGEMWWWLRFARTIPARDFCQGMGWKRPFARTVGTPLGSWQVILWRADLFDFNHRPIIRFALPQVGRWAVRTWLARRPPGPLPAVSSGGSPVYDLLRYDGEVGGLEVVPWKPEYDQTWVLEQARQRRLQHPIVSAVARPATYSGPCPVDVTFEGTLYDIRWPKVEVRWERSDGVWTDIEKVTIRAAHQPVRTTWRVGAPHQRLEVWQKLHLGPSTIASEPAKATINCE